MSSSWKATLQHNAEYCMFGIERAISSTPRSSHTGGVYGEDTQPRCRHEPGPQGSEIGQRVLLSENICHSRSNRSRKMTLARYDTRPKDLLWQETFTSSYAAGCGSNH